MPLGNPMAVQQPYDCLFYEQLFHTAYNVFYITTT